MVTVYKRGPKLSPVKYWSRYMTHEHDQYHGYCRHYDLPAELVKEALASGAVVLEEPMGCMKGR